MDNVTVAACIQYRVRQNDVEQVRRVAYVVGFYHRLLDTTWFPPAHAQFVLPLSESMCRCFSLN